MALCGISIVCAKYLRDSAPGAGKYQKNKNKYGQLGVCSVLVRKRTVPPTKSQYVHVGVYTFLLAQSHAEKQS